MSLHKIDIDALQQPEMALALIEQLRGGMMVRDPAHRVEKLVDGLLRGLPWFGYPINGISLLRGRVSEKAALDHVDEFGCPPAHLVRANGRCNFAGTSVFYGASNFDTIFSELQAEEGMLVHVGTARVSSEITVTAIGEIDHVRRNGRPLVGNDETTKMVNQILAKDDAETTRLMLVDAFFADIFSRPANELGGYKSTAALAKNLLDPTGKPVPLDGFFYPSVAHRGGMNLALSAAASKSKLTWTAFNVFKINHCLGYGIYLAEKVAGPAAPDATGKILWT